jgi:hypothetical protein
LATGNRAEQESNTMSEGHSEERPAGGGDVLAEPEVNPQPGAESPPQSNPSRLAALWLLGVVVVIVAGVALSPFWAPELAPLLPWGAKSGVSREDYDALAARVAADEKRQTSPSADINAIKSALGALGSRVDQLEGAVNARLSEVEKRPVPAGIDVDAVKSAQGVLAGRIDQLGQRLAAAETQSSTRATSEVEELRNIKNELSQLDNVTAGLAKRLPELEQQMQSQNGAQRTDAALAMLLLRIRDAVEQGRPFPTDYAALEGLAPGPDFSAAAAPLAEAAQNGAATRAVLSTRLAELSGRVATATEHPPESDWGAQALARLRGLVTIRRLDDGASQTGPEAAVTAAQAALARGDLAAAVVAFDPLTGANAAAAAPWLRMARERLAVEAALNHLEQSLQARLGGSRAAPGTAPAEPSGKTKVRS